MAKKSIQIHVDLESGHSIKLRVRDQQSKTKLYHTYLIVPAQHGSFFIVYEYVQDDVGPVLAMGREDFDQEDIEWVREAYMQIAPPIDDISVS